MRGLACLLMFQTHAYDSWLGPAWRQTPFLGYSQLLGTFPAPLFLFLAGVSLALGMERMKTKGATEWDITTAFARRGAQIFALGLLFRVQEYVIAYPWAPWTDLLRVDILNTIGLSLFAASIIPFLARKRWEQTAIAILFATLIAMATPPLWTTYRPRGIPWWLASYVNGGHTDYLPKPWLFPLFPWTAFAFAGAAVGLVFLRARQAGRERIAVLLIAGAGAGLWFLARWLDSLPIRLYRVYDYWHTSPNFLLARVAVLLVLFGACYAWCALKPGWLWSPVQQLGTTSLLVYWVHIEFVYGRFSILPKRSNSIEQASRGLAIIIAAMLALSLGRTAMKRYGPMLVERLRSLRGAKPQPA